ISSDEFFGKGTFDPAAQTEAKSRLQGFEGASSISSNAYFGREEDDAGEEDYGDLESAAKDFVRKFGVTAGDDLENLTQVLGEGATKLGGAVRASHAARQPDEGGEQLATLSLQLLSPDLASRNYLRRAGLVDSVLGTKIMPQIN
ncbi:hypothetical protein V490_04615, partial [Pseudogymnoascus sp. VKM F-3557]